MQSICIITSQISFLHLNIATYTLVRDQFGLSRLSNASTFRLTGIGHTSVETGETIRSIHAPIVGIRPPGRDATVDLPDWRTGRPTYGFMTRFALPLRHQSFLHFKGLELHASECLVLLTALSYRATWTEAITMLNNILFSQLDPLQAGAIGPIPLDEPSKRRPELHSKQGSYVFRKCTMHGSHGK